MNHESAIELTPGAGSLELWETALGDYVAGRRETPLLLVDRDGQCVRETFEQYFEEEGALSELDRAMLGRARGRVLDVGAGVGRHALPLRRAGHEVVAIDRAPLAVRLMRERGLEGRLADVWTYEDAGGFETILLAGHNIGMAGTLKGLRKLLERFAGLLAPGGRVLVNSIDLPSEAPRYDGQGRFLGEAMLHLEYGARRGPEFPWLCVDFRTLGELAGELGWRAERVAVAEDGDFLAELRRG